MTTVTIPAPVGEILKTLEAAGYGAWCVGGCVRDALLDRMPGDWDVTTSARPEETMALFAGRAVPTGLRHGTVTVKTEQGGVEITTLRRDGAYRDHRRPETVTFTDSLEEDLRRRDFTINAMAADLQGTLYDPLGGRADLTAKVLRCVGEPDRRFGEDALRILRGLRFAAELGVTVHPDTAVAIHRNRELLRAIAPERIWAELKKLVSGKWAAEVLRAYPDVAGVFWPEILPMVGFDQRNGHHCYDVWEHTLHAMEKVKPEPELRLTMLLHDIGKPNCFTVDGLGCGHFYGHPAESARMAEAMLGRLRPRRFSGRRWCSWWLGMTATSHAPAGRGSGTGGTGGAGPAASAGCEASGQSGSGPGVPLPAGGDRQGGMHPGPAAGGGRLRIPAAAGGERAGPAGHGTLRPRGGTDFAGTAERCAG